MFGREDARCTGRAKSGWAAREEWTGRTAKEEILDARAITRRRGSAPPRMRALIVAMCQDGVCPGLTCRCLVRRVLSPVPVAARQEEEEGPRG
jgi:hypothetical protein